MLETAELQDFLRLNPLIKRILIVRRNDSERYILWANGPEELTLHCWKNWFSAPARLVPKEPLEGGYTQELWNKLWDDSDSLGNRIRLSTDQVLTPK